MLPTSIYSLSAGAVVLNDQNEILLIQGPDRGWEFPGGIVEPGKVQLTVSFAKSKKSLELRLKS